MGFIFDIVIVVKLGLYAHKNNVNNPNTKTENLSLFLTELCIISDKKAQHIYIIYIQTCKL